MFFISSGIFSGTNAASIAPTRTESYSRATNCPSKHFSTAREYDSVLVGAMLAALVPENIPEEMKNMLPANLWPAVQANVAQGLLTAVDCLRRQQETHSGWTN